MTPFPALVVLVLVAMLLSPASVGADEQVSEPTPREDVKALVDGGLPFAEQMLREHGEFFPFGVAMTTGGQIQWVAADDGREQPPSQELIDLLLARFRHAAEEGQYRAVAIFADVRTLDPRTNKRIEAVQISLEHLAGYCGDMFIPYTLPLRELNRGNVMLAERKGAIFGNCR